MFRKSFKKLQTAQGMVEFALVLPILLLLVLGIFAFGHLFFVYSSVVSASREAARWGAAVGEAPSEFARYQDCDAIRASAVRLGSFAGVNSSDIDDDDDTGIEISFDSGPNESGVATAYASCPAGEQGPADVKMGDRIVVRVKVNYTPIVPFLNLPSFPLEATTFRTILRSVPVGEAPTAVDPCTSTTHIELDEDSSVVGQEAVHWARVVADDLKVDYPPTGTVYLYDDGDPVYMCEGTLEGETENTSVFVCPDLDNYPVYVHAGERTIRVVYESDDVCFNSSSTESPGPDPVHIVEPAATDLVLGVSPPTGHVNESLTVTVRAQAVAPGAGTPTGWVVIKFPGQADRAVDLVDGAATSTYVPTVAGSFTITVEYPEEADLDFLGVTETINVTIVSATSTPAATPTLVFTPTPIMTPTKTPLPAYCPQLSSDSQFFSIGSAIQLSINNPNVSGSSNTTVSSVELSWPSDPAANMQEIRFGSSVNTCDPSGGNGNCLWQNAAGLGPTHQNITSSTAGWNSDYAELRRNATKTMRLVFNHSLPRGSYHLIIRFSTNNCQLEIEREKVTD
jgi:hypothetical protein